MDKPIEEVHIENILPVFKLASIAKATVQAGAPLIKRLSTFVAKLFKKDHCPKVNKPPAAGQDKWAGNNPIDKGYTNGMKRLHTDLPGGVKAAEEMFKSYAKRNVQLNDKGYDMVKLSDSSYIVYRPQGKTGEPKIEIVQPKLGTYEKITFKER